MTRKRNRKAWDKRYNSSPKGKANRERYRAHLLVRAKTSQPAVSGPIICWRDAMMLGLKRYFTGLPCRHGHIAERFTSSWKCIQCQREYSPTKRRGYQKKWSALHRDQRRKALAKWRAENPDKNKEYNRRHRLKSVEWRRAHAKKWRKENPEYFNHKSANRRAMKRNAEGSYTLEDIKRIYRLQKGRCAYCRAELGSHYEQDHIVPLSKGGTNYPNNIQLLCYRRSPNVNHCNQRKRDKDPIVFARECGLLI